MAGFCPDGMRGSKGKGVWRVLPEIGGMVSLLDHILQLFASEEDAAFDGTERQAQRIRDLLVFVPQVVHFKRNAQGVVEAFHHAGELVHHDIGLGVIADSGRTAIDVVEVFCRVDDRPGLRVFAVVVDEDILHDRQQPGFQVGTRNELVYVADGPERGFLIEVFGLFAVLGQFVRECMKGSAETVELLSEIRVRHGVFVLLNQMYATIQQITKKA